MDRPTYRQTGQGGQSNKSQSRPTDLKGRFNSIPQILLKTLTKTPTDSSAMRVLFQTVRTILEESLFMILNQDCTDITAKSTLLAAQISRYFGGVLGSSIGRLLN